MRKQTKNKIPEVFLLLIAMGVFYCLSMNTLFAFFSTTDITVDPTQSLLYGSFLSTPLGMILLKVILAPFAEEYLFRKLLFGKLREKLAFLPAALISSVVFGILHLSIGGGIYGLLIGLLLAEVYEETGRIGASILLHASANVLSVLFTFWTAGNAFVYEHRVWIFFLALALLILSIFGFEKRIRKVKTA